MEENKEVKYGIGTRISDQEDWKKFMNLYNEKTVALGYAEEAPLSGDLETDEFPAMVAIKTFTRSELEEAIKNNEFNNTVDPKSLFALLDICDEYYSICLFRMD